jgi:hypothetical protein
MQGVASRVQAMALGPTIGTIIRHSLSSHLFLMVGNTVQIMIFSVYFVNTNGSKKIGFKKNGFDLTDLISDLISKMFFLFFLAFFDFSRLSSR